MCFQTQEGKGRAEAGKHWARRLEREVGAAISGRKEREQRGVSHRQLIRGECRAWLNCS